MRTLTIGRTEHRAERGAYRTLCGKSVELAMRRTAYEVCPVCDDPSVTCAVCGGTLPLADAVSVTYILTGAKGRAHGDCALGDTCCYSLR